MARSARWGNIHMAAIQLIVGLANPGASYEKTRHNAGAWFIECLVKAAKTTLRAQAKYHGLHQLLELHHHAFHVLVPSTFMNHSGQAVHACMNYLKLTPESILIVHDEVDLPAGVIKLKFDGGDGGHNGLKDVISHLHTKQFYRLRVGVGRPQQSNEVADYVLKKPSKTDRQHIDLALEKACDVLPLILNGEIQKAMHQLHT